MASQETRRIKLKVRPGRVSSPKPFGVESRSHVGMHSHSRSSAITTCDHDDSRSITSPTANFRDTADQAESSSRPAYSPDLRERIKVVRRRSEAICASTGGGARVEKSEGKRRWNGNDSSLTSPLTPSLSPAELVSLGYVADSELFGKLPILYHPRYTFFRCSLCETGLKNVASHFSSSPYHPKLVAEALRRLPGILERYPESDPLQALPSGLSAEKRSEYIPGIDLTNGFICHNCQACTSGRPGMIRHLLVNHNIPKRNAEWQFEPCENLQRFTRAQNQANWFPSAAPPTTIASPSSQKRPRLTLRAPQQPAPTAPIHTSQPPRLALAMASSPRSSRQRDETEGSASSRSSTSSLSPPPSDVASSSPSDAPGLPGWVIDNELFGDLPVAYNREYRIYRCNLCDRGIPNVKYHFQQVYSHPIIYPLDSLPEMLAKYPEEDPYARLSPSLSATHPHPTHISGIHYVAEGYGCPTCSHFSISISNIHAHNIRAHGQAVGTEPVYKIVPNCQRFFATSSPWFPSAAAPRDVPVFSGQRSEVHSLYYPTPAERAAEYRSAGRSSSAGRATRPARSRSSLANEDTDVKAARRVRPPQPDVPSLRLRGQKGPPHSSSSSTAFSLTPEPIPSTSTPPSRGTRADESTKLRATIRTMKASATRAQTTISSLKSTVASLEQKQVETEESLRLAMERNRDLEALIESGAAGPNVLQLYRATLDMAATEKVHKPEGVWGRAHVDGLDVEKGNGVDAGNDVVVKEEVEDCNWVLRDEDDDGEDYIPLAVMDTDGGLYPEHESTDVFSRDSSRASSYEAFQEAIGRAGQDED